MLSKYLNISCYQLKHILGWPWRLNPSYGTVNNKLHKEYNCFHQTMTCTDTGSQLVSKLSTELIFRIVVSSEIWCLSQFTVYILNTGFSQTVPYCPHLPEIYQWLHKVLQYWWSTTPVFSGAPHIKHINLTQ